MIVTSVKPEIVTSLTDNAILKNISWQTYLAILTDMGNHRSTRLSYDRQTLEIRMPLEFHEAINRLLERIIVTLTEELGLDIKSFDSTTSNRKDLEVGIEPDACFYIQNSDRIRRFQIDMGDDPAPDLVIEVDIYSSSNRRLEIYKQLGVPEIWRYTRTGIKIYSLQNGEYLEQEYSCTFPTMSAKILDRFLELSESMVDNKLIREFRSWLQKNIKNSPQINVENLITF